MLLASKCLKITGKSTTFVIQHKEESLVQNTSRTLKFSKVLLPMFSNKYMHLFALSAKSIFDLSCFPLVLKKIVCKNTLSSVMHLGKCVLCDVTKGTDYSPLRLWPSLVSFQTACDILLGYCKQCFVFFLLKQYCNTKDCSWFSRLLLRSRSGTRF